jgi:antitoxin ParD1/3/4
MTSTEQLTVELPAELVAGLRNSVRSGAFASESEAIETLLGTWFGPEGTEEPDIETLRAIVAEGIADADAGRFVEAHEMFEELRVHYGAAIAKRADD